MLFARRSLRFCPLPSLSPHSSPLQLPDVDPPYIFGLPDNIERSLQRTTSAAVIRQLRALSNLNTEASKFDREKWRVQLGPVLDLWQHLTSGSPGLLAKAKPSAAGRDSGANSPSNSIDDFVGMENKLASDLCYSVDVLLSSLKKVLFGSGLLTPAIQTAAASLLAGATPSEWSSKWEGPEKPQAWLSELVRKRMALLKWQTAASKGNLLEEPRSLGDLFNPATFVNALRQQTARHLNTAIDRVKLVCLWDSKRGDSFQSFARKYDCQLHCQLTGLLLQGASFSNGALQESPSEGSELSVTADVKIAFIAKDSDNDPYGSQETISIPVYFTLNREEFLMELKMPISQSTDTGKWTLAGVGLFLNEGE
jgi:dynein heavy chain 2, cytosolic